jgi:hypothetical protein
MNPATVSGEGEDVQHRNRCDKGSDYLADSRGLSIGERHSRRAGGACLIVLIDTENDHSACGVGQGGDVPRQLPAIGVAATVEVALVVQVE